MGPRQTPAAPPANAPYVHDDHTSASHGPVHVADPSGRGAALRTLRRGPRGAATLASIALGVVLLLWILFYLFIFLPRGPVE